MSFYENTVTTLNAFYLKSQKPQNVSMKYAPNSRQLHLALNYRRISVLLFTIPLTKTIKITFLLQPK